MRDFADLLDRLIYTRSRNAKLKLIADYLTATPDPDRGWAMAALTGNLDLPAVKPAMIRALIEERVDPVLFHMSRDYVGDSAETEVQTVEGVQACETLVERALAARSAVVRTLGLDARVLTGQMRRAV